MTASIETLKLPPGAVLIIGAGLAGLFAAIKLRPRPVIVMTAAPVGHGASSAWAQGGLAAAVGPDDNPALHLADTIAAGAGLVDDAAAQFLVEAAAARLEDLTACGVPFERTDDGAYALGREAAHSRNRIVHAGGDKAGAAIMAALIETAEASDHITFLEGYAAEDLLRAEHGVCGVVAAKVGAPPDAARIVVPAGHTILATGGIGGLYSVTTNPPHAQGHGLAMAARAGAEILDPEFVQFHPTALDVGADPAPLATEALRGAGAALINKNGDRFMVNIHPDAELAPRDIVARAVAKEIAEGRGAFLDARDAVGAAFPDKFPAVYAACAAASLDPVRAPLPIAPAVHYHMGGVRTDRRGQTSAPGLWACGEVAGTGVHGANRLASNSLLEAVAFGAAIAETLDGADTPAPGTAHVPEDRLQLTPKPAAGDDFVRLRRTMTAGAGLLRRREDLANTLQTLHDIEHSATTSGLYNAALTGKLIAAAAFARTESRGGHARTDFPDTNEAWARHTVLTLKDAEALAADASG
ncbi:MAG: L-aspartate oxidase [Pseudomonadota bacterium]